MLEFFTFDVRSPVAMTDAASPLTLPDESPSCAASSRDRDARIRACVVAGGARAHTARGALSEQRDRTARRDDAGRSHRRSSAGGGRRQGALCQGARARDERRARGSRRAFVERRADGIARRIHAGRHRCARGSPRRVCFQSICRARRTSRRCDHRYVEPPARSAAPRAIPEGQGRAASRQRQHALTEARRGPLRRDDTCGCGIEATRLRRSNPRAPRAGR